MSKTLNKYIRALDYADKTLFVLSVASSVFSLCSFTTVIGAHVGIASATISLAVFICNGIVTMLLKTMGRNKNKHRKIAILARNKLKSIKSNIR